jgi:hypothetical protein
MNESALRCALYARVSALDQQPENQLTELRRSAARSSAAILMKRGARTAFSCMCVDR